MKPSECGERADRYLGRHLRLHAAFLLGTVLFGCVLVTLSACGDDDIVMPGEIPYPTRNPSAVATETPEI